MTKSLVALLFLVQIGAIIAASEANAHYRTCYRPDAPFCIDGYGTFDSDWSFQSCKSEVERYVADMNEYSSCVIRQTKREVSEVEDETSRTIEKFNCNARGELYCP